LEERTRDGNPSASAARGDGWPDNMISELSPLGRRAR